MYKVFDYQCRKCGNIDEHLVNGDLLTKICSSCGEVADRIISPGHGGIHTDTSAQTWLPSALDVLVKPGDRRPETRDEYKKYMKKQGYSAIGGDVKIDGKYSMV